MKGLSNYHKIHRVGNLLCKPLHEKCVPHHFKNVRTTFKFKKIGLKFV